MVDCTSKMLNSEKTKRLQSSQVIPSQRLFTIVIHLRTTKNLYYTTCYIKSKWHVLTGISTLRVNGTIIRDSFSRAEILNQHFKSVFTIEDFSNLLGNWISPYYFKYVTSSEKTQFPRTQQQDTLFTIKWWLYTLTNNSPRHCLLKFPKLLLLWLNYFWGLSENYKCSGVLQMAPSPLDKQAAGCTSLHDWLMSWPWF